MILRQSQTNASRRAIRQTLMPLWAVVVAAALSIAASGATQGETAPPYTNRLVHSADPYLLLHAHNPVDWYPWGPEAFAKAKAENKPIFISIGYSSCYWCHVAEKEIYSDPDTATLMNKWFVNVKVDREERPDVDRFYILATEILTEHGAWPNNLFLTPDGRPFYAGSYFPPRDGGGETPGFPRVLAAIHDLWDHKRSDQVEPAANNVMAALRDIEAKRSTAASVPVTPAAWLATGATSLLRSVDPEHGGFGNPQTGPKFPQAPALALLAAAATLDNNAPANAALQNTLAAMAFGGVRDQLAGGFHRYATEPTWSLPHFEKMLSDNAQLLAIYTAAFARTGNALDRAIALDTARYLMRDMALAEGGFATAQDAETKGVEGATYLWTRAEIEAVLGAADTETFLAIYELTPLPDAPSGAAVSLEALGQLGVLRVRLPIAATLQRANVADAAAMFAALAPLRDKLLAARSNRTQPLRDDKIVTDLNGLAIGALAKAGAVLKEPAFIDTATKAATRIWSLAYDAKDGKLKHQIFEGRAAVDGFLDDYAALGDGLLTLAEVTHVSLWHDRATVLGDATVSRFLRADGGLSTGDGERLLPVAVSDGEDADTPSGTSNALRLLARLGADGGERFAQAAARVSTHLASALAAQPTVWPSAVVTLAEYPPIAKPQVAAAAAGPPPSSDVPSSAQHVHASAVLLADPGGDAVAVTLKIDPGFHVNGHAPNLDYLVPSVVSFDAAAPSRIDYPESSLFKASFAKDPLLVYEGTAKIIAHFDGLLPRGGGALTARISVQACDARTCLPPTELLAPVRPAEMPSASR